MTDAHLQHTIETARHINAGTYPEPVPGLAVLLAAALITLADRIAALPPVAVATATNQPNTGMDTPDTPAATTAKNTTIQREPVKSSNIKSIGYDRGTLLLEVEFLNGAVWCYANVLPDRHLGLMEADSIGSYFARYIKGKHEARRIEQPATTGEVPNAS